MQDDLHAPMLQSGAAQQSGRKFTIVLSVLAVILGSLLIATVAVSKAVLATSNEPLTSPLDHLAKQFADALPDSFLPTRFAVDRDYLSHPMDQGSRGTCWSFATIWLLQSQYRGQGIKQGYLKEDEHVNFSVQAFLSLVGNWCREHRDAQVCQYGGFLKNTTNDNQIEALPWFMKAIPELYKSIVPGSVCPYIETKSPETDFQCDGLDDALKYNNPIEFKIKSIRTVYDERGVKQLLLSANRPLGIGTPTGSIVYNIPCEGSQYNNTDECINQVYPCPDIEGAYCYRVSATGHSTDGVFVSPENIEDWGKMGGHAMNVVGYNDAWVYNNRFGAPEALGALKGCFILHNSWGSAGHSLDFLLGTRTLENEMATCPNHEEPLNWVPAFYTEVVQNNGDHTKCTTDIGMSHVRGHGRTKNADLLVCRDSTNASCTKGNKYIIGRSGNDINTTLLSTGLHQTEFIDVTNPSDIKSITVTYPFHALGGLFTPVEIVQNDIHDCGYFAFPYETMEQLRRREWALFDNFKVSDIELEFTSSSYVRSPDFKGNATHLQASTFQVPEIEFDGPIPFDWVYL